ncbi:DUF1403 family protein [Agrobacterium tumefaciens]|uniref:DUF1403 family protein n=1 Tax=Agrobacterium tumefaciens TaxID=358 RepID=UPI001F23B032|nr:DUF1403 family protein [Agrobacterium tumefaciens]
MPDSPPTFPPVPDWARVAGARRAEGDAELFAGAALGGIHPIARSHHPLGQLWRQRLALQSAEAIVRMQGRTEDAAALRDHFYLTRPGDDPGPAGRLLQAWRALGRGSSLGPASLNGEWPVIFTDLLSVTIDEPAQQVIDSALAASVGTRNPIEAASATVATSLALRPDSRPLALWLADAVLARRLNWAVPVPLLAAHLKREELRLAAGPHADAKRWRTACSFAYGRGASVALDLYADLARRADRLLAVAPQLRSKDADAMVATLISEDAQAAQSGRTVSDRSSRRLFERLVALGGVRELTGRPTFRLYGL